MTVFIVLRKLNRWTLKEDEASHIHFIRAQALSKWAEQAREKVLEPLLISMGLNDSLERYERFVVQESLNPACSFVEFQTPLTTSKRESTSQIFG